MVPKTMRSGWEKMSCANVLFNGYPLFAARAEMPIISPNAGETNEPAIPAYTMRGGEVSDAAPFSKLEILRDVMLLSSGKHKYLP